MIKKLFYSALVFAFTTAIGFAQTTYYLQGSLPNNYNPMDILGNWTANSDGTGSSPLSFSNSNDIWDLNGRYGNLFSGNLTIAGTITNSGFTPSIIDVNGKDLVIQGATTVNQITIEDQISGGSVEYSGTGPTDIISGTYTDLAFSGSGTFTATGNIAISGTLTTSGSSEIILDMNAHTLSDSGSFAIGSLGTDTLVIQTQSTALTPIPEANWPAGTKIVFDGTGSQYIPTGTYDNLELSGSTKTIVAGDSVKVNTGFSNTDNLILEATSASNYAQLVSDATMTGGGDIEQQVYLDLGASSGRYFHLGSGVAASQYNSIVEAGATMVAANDATGSIWLWTGTSANWTVPASASTNTTPGEGFAVYVGSGLGGPYVRSGSGVVSWDGSNIVSGDVSNTLNYFDPPGNDTNFVDPINDDGWNLRAHPYTANYDFETQTLAVDMYNSYSVWNGTNYLVYQQGTGGSAPRYIAPGQAVWLRTDNTVSFDFEISNARMNSSSTLKSSAIVNDLVSLHVKEIGGVYHDDVFIRLYNQASDADEPIYDAAKMFNPGDVPNLYVKLHSGSFAICGANVSRSTFPLYFMDANDGQQMEISLNKNTLTSYGNVFLEDKKNNSYTELTTGSYTFQNDKSFGADRFVLHFEKGVGLPEGMIPDATNYDAFYGNGSINFIFQEESFAPTSGGLYSLQGKLIRSFEINDASTNVSVPNVSTGIYLLALDNDVAGARKIYINK